MNNTVALRALMIYASVVLVALLVGYLLATPLTYQSILTVSIVLGLLVLPVMLRWHHDLAIICWNLTMLVPLLPGKANLSYVIAGVSLAMSIVTRTLQNKRTYVGSAWVTYPLLALTMITLLVMRATGGLQSNALGTENWGGGRYIGILGAIVGYFAFVARPVPLEKARLLASLYFLSGISAIWPVLIVLAGPTFYILLGLFPSTLQGGIGFGVGEGEIFERYIGVTWLAQAVIMFMLIRYGIRGLLNVHRPWRLLLTIGMFCAGLLGGFRSFIVILGMLFMVQFFLEGLILSRYFGTLLLCGILAAAILFPFIKQFPLSVQRSVSFIPGIEIDAAARLEAESSLSWRTEMWEIVWPEVPKYLFRPKGYGFSGSDAELTQQAMQRGRFAAYETAMITGDYHQGLLTLVIPLGIYGLVAFAAFCFGSLKVLIANYRFGDSELKVVNSFLLAFFITRLLYFLVLYGEFYLDLLIFTGAVGLSLTVNGGVRTRRQAALEPAQAMERTHPARLEEQPA